MHRQNPLHRQHKAASSIVASFVHAPSAPASLSRLAVELERGVFAVAAHPAGRSMLGELQASLFVAYGREREARTLWHESLATAACAELLAGFNGASIGGATLGALLHRAGEAWMLRALASTEAQSGARLNNPSRARLSAREAATCAERLTRDWRLSDGVARCVTSWQKCPELGAPQPEIAAVYCGRLLALEVLQPQFCAPDAISAAAREQGFDGDALARVRTSDDRIRELLRALD
jgi:HD-like signal output (HDOD) protein